MESFNAEGFENSEPIEPTPETQEKVWPGKEAVLHDATERAVDAYLERLKSPEAEKGRTFTGENSKPFEPRHPADEHVLTMEHMTAAAKSTAAEAIASNDPHHERMTHVLEAMNRGFEEGARRLAELYDNNPEAARRLAAELPDIRNL